MMKLRPPVDRPLARRRKRIKLSRLLTFIFVNACPSSVESLGLPGILANLFTPAVI